MIHIHIRHPFLLSCAFLVVVFFDGTGIVQWSLLAILLHEAGHIMLYNLLHCGRPILQIGWGGIALHWNTSGIPVHRQVMILLAGPLINIAAAILSFIICTQSFRLTVVLFGGINLLLGLFNLLPLGFLDGGRLLELFLSALLPANRTETVLLLFQTICLILISLFLLFFTTEWTTRIALLLFLGYYCGKSFCSKN